MKDLYADDPPFIDVALTLRSCGSGYMIVLAMYLNTLLLIAINLKIGIRPQEDEMPQLVFPTTSPKDMRPTPEKKEPESPFGKYDEAHTQEEVVPVAKEPPSPKLLPLAKTAPATPKKDKTPGKEKEKGKEKKDEKEKDKSDKAHKGDKTLKSARMSIRLPRAPKGHHDEELEQMEKFLAEDDMSAIEK
ncbi:hypothetical protein Y032_0149g2703 [Ancylostoma ceylanicum]|uniref:Uncharacterized protein n=1 Tax=Ancylostoma ceylanicum TaxID=53326 RepID=A0A016T1S0_9BILA|nr:hypothetical protein Y032_0149g2703 [Ancylostoma ceylanicum]